jgi:Beta-lactamase superfamily domain
VAALLWLLAAGGCALTPPARLVSQGTPAPPEAREGTVQVHYLGVGGFLLQRGADAVLLAPSFTNPGLLQLTPFTPLHSDEARVDQCLRRVPGLAQVDFVLVGHAHYDHLLDVPRILQQHAPRATVLGSRTARHILAGAGLERRTLVVDDCAARGNQMGRWVYNARRTVRVLALASEHSAHLANYKLMTGHYRQDLRRLPATAFGWREGQTYAYLVDFLAPDGSVAFRVHTQDAASSREHGFLPGTVRRDGTRVDLAITCVGAFWTVPAYPEPTLDNTRPRHVMLGHWEDFFGNDACAPQEQPRPLVRMADLAEFIRRVERAKPKDARWWMPAPYSVHAFAPARSAPPEGKAPECTTRPGALPHSTPAERSRLDGIPL